MTAPNVQLWRCAAGCDVVVTNADATCLSCVLLALAAEMPPSVPPARAPLRLVRGEGE